MDLHEQQQFTAGWEKKREAGKLRFVLRQTTLYTLLFSMLSVLMGIFDTDFSTAVQKSIFSWRLLVSAFTGLLIGLLNWWLMERQYKKIKAEQ
ncbi:MAG: hypothetical protein IPK76_03625 [Lewinellaceae bacterium]|nr:hypothetical protein [Lewinellaceae bacterium]